MKITLNQKEIILPNEITLGELLRSEGIEGGHVAVAINQTIIKRANWDATSLNEGDKILIIGAVKGG